MKKHPLISVVVPIYNVERFLVECIESILSQTYDNIEVILIDDGSTDKSGLIADKYSNNNKKIQVIHKKNAGLSDSRNTGIRLAKGEWIAFVDSDDYLDKHFLSTLLKLATETDADIATCNFCAFSTDGSPLKKRPSWPTGILTGEKSVEYILRDKLPTYICLSIFKTKLFQNNATFFPEGKSFEDITTRIKAQYYASKVIHTNEQLYFYRIRKNSITGKSFTSKRYNDYLLAIDETKKFVKSSNNSSIISYLNFFEFSSLITLLNYIAKDPAQTKELNRYWKAIRNKLKTLRPNTKFPSFKQAFVYNMAYFATSSRLLYSKVYRKAKK